MFKDIKKFFSDFFKKMKNSSSAKYLPLIVTAALLAILVPSIIAVCHTYFGEDVGFFSSEDISVSLYSSDGDLLARDSISLTNIDDSYLARMLYELKAEEASADKGFIADGSYNYLLHIESTSSVQKYRCYFSLSALNSFLEGEDGTIYSLNSDNYDVFLNSDYSEFIYSAAKLPSLMTNGGENVIPAETDWIYAKVDGEYVPSVLSKETTKVILYEMNGSIGLSFDRTPTASNVILTDESGNKVYEGDLEALSSLTVESNQVLYAKLSASWEKSQDYDSYGSAEYSFKIVCTASTSFLLSSETVSPGGLLTIFAHGVADGAEPVYSPIVDADSENSIFSKNIHMPNTFMSDREAIEFLGNFSPAFIRSNSSMLAFVPIPYNTPSGTFSFTLSSGISSVEMKIEITEEKERSSITSTKSKKLINNVTSRTAIYEIEKLLVSITPICENALYYRSAFLSPEEYAFSRSYSYGDSFIVGGDAYDFSAIGNAYSSKATKQNVLCANIGKVIYSGQTAHLGNFVIVDHGMGLCTWYCNLGSIDVAVGDVVAKGQLVGKTGPSTLLEEQGVLILCSVHGTLIDPDEILGKEIKDLSSDPSQEETK